MLDYIRRGVVGALDNPEESTAFKVVVTVIVSACLGLGLGDGVVP